MRCPRYQLYEGFYFLAGLYASGRDFSNAKDTRTQCVKLKSPVKQGQCPNRNHPLISDWFVPQTLSEVRIPRNSLSLPKHVLCSSKQITAGTWLLFQTLQKVGLFEVSWLCCCWFFLSIVVLSQKSSPWHKMSLKQACVSWRKALKQRNVFKIFNIIWSVLDLRGISG